MGLDEARTIIRRVAEAASADGGVDDVEEAVRVIVRDEVGKVLASSFITEDGQIGHY